MLQLIWIAIQQPASKPIMMLLFPQAMEQNTRSINTHGYKHAGTVSLPLLYIRTGGQVVCVSWFMSGLHTQILKGWRRTLTRTRAAGTATALKGIMLQVDTTRAAAARSATALSPTGRQQEGSRGKGPTPPSATAKTTETETETTTDQTAETETDRTGEWHRPSESFFIYCVREH